MYTKSERLERLLKDLTLLRQKAIEGILPKKKKNSKGICNYVGVVALAPVWHEVITTWPHFSGGILYPIPSTAKGVSPEKHYFRYELWIGEQRKLRISLLDHLIKAVKIEIEKEKGMRASTPNPT